MALKMLPIAMIFMLTQKILHEIICHIANGNPLPTYIIIEKYDDARVANVKFATAIFNNTTN